ncbi:MAG: acyl-CoA thioesterase [Deltaproteobacteria bacterium]|nr:acyl-CoA thioesterase [Deltaproteobacteria bacterium]
MKLKFKHSLHVRFSDVDGLAHTNNAAYITYFEEARLAYVKALGYDRARSLKDFSFILAHVSCDFKAPSFGGDSLDIFCGITRIGNSSFDMDYEVKDHKTGTLLASGKTVQVTYNYHENKVVPMMDKLRKKIENFEKSLS